MKIASTNDAGWLSTGSAIAKKTAPAIRNAATTSRGCASNRRVGRDAHLSAGVNTVLHVRHISPSLEDAFGVSFEERSDDGKDAGETFDAPFERSDPVSEVVSGRFGHDGAVDGAALRWYRVPSEAPGGPHSAPAYERCASSGGFVASASDLAAASGTPLASSSSTSTGVASGPRLSVAPHGYERTPCSAGTGALGTESVGAGRRAAARGPSGDLFTAGRYGAEGQRAA
jgi:hypothetical protein